MTKKEQPIKNDYILVLIAMILVFSLFFSMIIFSHIDTVRQNTFAHEETLQALKLGYRKVKGTNDDFVKAGFDVNVKHIANKTKILAAESNAK